MSRDQFASFVQDAILSLPQDMKTILRIVEDPDIDDRCRVAAAGALLHVLSGANAIPGLRGVLAYADDAIVLRLVLEQILKDANESMDGHRADTPDLFGTLDEHLALVRSYLGAGAERLEHAAKHVSQLSHQGHSAQSCVTEPEGGTWLYDTVQEALVDELEFDEDEVHRACKGVEQIVTQLKQRR